MRNQLIGAALVAVSLVGCGRPALDGGTQLSCAGTVVAVVGNAELGCDMQPGQRLDVLDVPVGDCLDMGGTPRPDTDSAIGNADCEGVDF